MGAAGRKTVGPKSDDRFHHFVRDVLLAGTMVAENQSLEDHKLALLPGGHNHTSRFRHLDSLPPGSENLLRRKQ